MLRYDESLSPSLAPTAFEVTVNGETRNPDSVTHFPVDGVTFVFGSDFRAGDDVEISYTVPATNPSRTWRGTTRLLSPVKRWRGGQMMLRWVAAGVLEAVKGFRRLKGCGDMPRLVSALRARDQRLGLGVSEVNVA